MFTEEQIVLVFLLSMCAVVFGMGLLNQRGRRRFAVRPMNRQRIQFSIYEQLVKYAAKHDREQFFRYTRMSPEMFNHLLNLINVPHLEKRIDRNPISPGERLAMTLHYLSEGCSMQEIAWNNFVGKSTVHYIIKETCKVIWEVLSPVVLPQPTVADLSKIATENYKRWNLPNCIGSVDGKHVEIQNPQHSGTTFFSYKKSFSLVLMAVCDAYYKFTYVDIGAAGSNHDSTIFKNSSYGAALLNETLNIPPPKNLPGTNISFPVCFVADQAFPLHRNIMRPYPGSFLGETKNIFNLRLSRVRRTIENTFGILVQRWRRLRSPIIAGIEMCEDIVKAIIVLHNYVQKGEEDIPVQERRYCPTGFVDWEDEDGEVHAGQWREMRGRLRSVGRLGSNNATRAVQELRDTLAAYLITPAGAVPYQWNKVQEGAVPDGIL